VQSIFIDPLWSHHFKGGKKKNQDADTLDEENFRTPDKLTTASQRLSQTELLQDSTHHHAASGW
jgi:hypothetical protein